LVECCTYRSDFIVTRNSKEHFNITDELDSITPDPFKQQVYKREKLLKSIGQQAKGGK